MHSGGAERAAANLSKYIHKNTETFVISFYKSKKNDYEYYGYIIEITFHIIDFREVLDIIIKKHIPDISGQRYPRSQWQFETTSEVPAEFVSCLIIESESFQCVIVIEGGIVPPASRNTI